MLGRVRRPARREEAAFTKAPGSLGLLKEEKSKFFHCSWTRLTGGQEAAVPLLCLLGQKVCVRQQ